MTDQSVDIASAVKARLGELEFALCSAQAQYAALQAEHAQCPKPEADGVTKGRALKAVPGGGESG